MSTSLDDFMKGRQADKSEEDYLEDPWMLETCPFLHDWPGLRVTPGSQERSQSSDSTVMVTGG